MNVSSSAFAPAAAVVIMLCSPCGVALAQDTQPAAPPQVEQPQNPPPGAAKDPVAATIGTWELSNADHDKTCRLNFRADAVPGGHKLDIDKNCPNVFPSTGDIVAWNVDNYGNLKLLDDHGDAVIELTEVEGGMYDGFKPEEGRYILQAAAAVQTHSADDLAGEWAVARGGGKPICMLSLLNSAIAAGGDYLALKVKPGCDTLVTRFGPTTWRMDNGDLLLTSPRGQTWRFEQNDNNTWQRVPETADPLLLVRQ